MITKFDSLFAGHVDMDNAGYEGTPVNDRRFPNEHLATVFDKTAAVEQRPDRRATEGKGLERHGQMESHSLKQGQAQHELSQTP